jgi:hypothetical protein
LKDAIWVNKNKLSEPLVMFKRFAIKTTTTKKLNPAAIDKLCDLAEEVEKQKGKKQKMNY